MTPVLAPITRLLAQPLTVAAMAVQALRPAPLTLPAAKADLSAPLPAIIRVADAAPANHAAAPAFAAPAAVPVLKAFYAVRVSGLENLPEGGALVLPNHASFLDPVLAAYALGRPARFLMYRPYYETFGLQWLFRSLGVIPISHKDPKEKIEESLNRARRALAAGETVVIFPEGNVTPDGEFQVFRRGFERVAAGLSAPVVPMHIAGMWGSLTSRHPGKGWLASLKARLRGRRAVAVRLGPPLDRADAESARAAVMRLAARP